MSDPLAESFAYCQRVTRAAATNFYYSFLVLPRPRRQAMWALYAYLRQSDDLADCNALLSARREALVKWRQSLDRALAGEFDSPLWPAVAHIVEQFNIPPQLLYDVLDGVEADLDHTGYETFAELEAYCHLVASAVGLACLRIWGCNSDEAHAPARDCALAFQLTNILRDIEEDAERGRVYLPREDLQQFNYSVDELKAGVRDNRFRALMRFEIDRAMQYYRNAEKLSDYLDADGRAVLGTMTSIYRGLLERISALDGDVFGRRVRLSRWRKMLIAAQWILPRAAQRLARRNVGTVAR